jgi:hypothetical protein
VTAAAGGGIDWGTAPQWISGVVSFMAFGVSLRAMSTKASDDKIDALKSDIGDVKASITSLDKRVLSEDARIFERQDEAESRLARLETELQHLPTKDSLHAIEVKLTEQGTMLRALMATLDRLQNHLLAREEGGR